MSYPLSQWNHMTWFETTWISVRFIGNNGQDSRLLALAISTSKDKPPKSWILGQDRVSIVDKLIFSDFHLPFCSPKSLDPSKRGCHLHLTSFNPFLLACTLFKKNTHQPFQSFVKNRLSIRPTGQPQASENRSIASVLRPGCCNRWMGETSRIFMVGFSMDKTF